jgi:crotonobetainyl-CoA:carnitine CoA-transferase CaiB-like acyl-CoA transferase
LKGNKEDIVKKPLEGIRVLDLGHVLAMPTCTMQLADLGAEVIKIERPGIGDDSLNFGPFKNNESAYFISINRNKKSITLDLKKEKGKKIFKDLVKVSDVVTENYKELKPIITEWSKEKTMEETLNILINAGVPVGEVNTLDKIVDDPDIKLREMIVEVEHPLAGKVKITDTPIKLSLTPGKVEKASLLLGQHTEEILKELLDLSKEDIKSLKKEGVV